VGGIAPVFYARPFIPKRKIQDNIRREVGAEGNRPRGRKRAFMDTYPFCTAPGIKLLYHHTEAKIH
jgi:hypothetical protein